MENKDQIAPRATNSSKDLRRLSTGMFAFFALILVLGAAAWFSRAASVTSRKDTMSGQGTSATANHSVSFNLSGGNTLSAGEQVAIDFPHSSAFTTNTSWVTTDFAFADGTARTIVDVDAGPGVTTVDACTAGANNVGVAVDTTSIVFRVIPCTGYTASAAGAFLTVTISGTSPDGTLTNPSTAGSYVIDIPDAAGDCQAASDDCGLAVAIVDASNVGVTATVTATGPVCGNGVVESGESCDDGNVVGGDGCSATCSTEGGGGPPPPPDTTPPVISSITVTNITSTGATINWNTNEGADSTVNYGLTASYGSQVYDPGLVTSHSRPLTGLSNGTVYHFQVCSKDGANNQSCSADQTFTTTDTSPPSITNVQVTNITGTSATITWDTNEDSTSFVDYGTAAGPPYSNSAGSDTPLTASHSVTLTGLTPSVQYHFRARSGDASGNEAITANATFTTSDVTPPAISNVQVVDITPNSVRVTWDTNEQATSLVDYGPTSGPPYPFTAGNTTPLTASHSVTIGGLAEGTTYHFRVRSADAGGNESTSADSTFTTIDATAPIITNVQVVDLTPSSARITWDTNEASDSIVEYGTTTGYGSQQSAVTPVTAHSVTLPGLTPNTLYHFRVRSTDAANNQGTSGDFTFTTPLPTPPGITNVQVTNITQTSARVTWTTSTPTDTDLDYGTTASYGSQANSATLETQHAVNLTGLTKGTTYHYRITATDAYGQTAQTTDAIFVTDPDTVAPANVTGLTATPGDSQIVLAWNNPSEPDFQGVRILRKTTGFPANPNDGDVAFSGNAETYTDTGLTNGIVYYYAVYSFDDVPNYSSGALASESPVGPPDITPPGNPSNFTATPGDAQVQLSWTNPGDVDFQGVRVLRKTDSAPTGPNDGTLVYDGSDTGRLDSGLANGTTYYYGIFAYDAVPNYSSGSQATATPVAPVDTTGPGPVTNFSATPGDAQVQLTWTNPNDVDWAGTRVLRKTGSNPTGPSDGTIVFEGVGDNRTDTFVVNGTTYYYGAFAYDEQLNFSAGAFASATPQQGLVIPPLACTDSDGGRNYDVQGSVTSDGATYNDTCSDADTVQENYCSGSVHQVESHACGDGFKCSGGACVPDEFVPTPEICGNAICAGNENSLNCPADCPVVPEEGPVTPDEPASTQRIDFSDLQFRATRVRINLRTTGSSVSFYAGMTVTVYLADEAIPKPIRSAFVNLDGRAYAMRQTASYEAVVSAPSSVGTWPFSVAIVYEDGTSDLVEGSVITVPRGLIYEEVDGKVVPVNGARVTLLVDEGGGNYGVWEGETYGQLNPTYTEDTGAFAFIVPAGIYRFRVDAAGFATTETLPFRVEGGEVLSRRIRLLRLPTPTDVGEVAEFIADTITEAIGEVIGNELVEEGVEDVAAPAATVAAVANVATAAAATATFAPALLNLWTLLAHPFLLFARRKRKQWGVVYDSLRKLPVDLAIVRLVDAKTGRILRSAVTDKEGRYFFIVQPGEYKLTVAKVGYVFPTVHLKSQKADGKFIDLYHGEAIAVKTETSITANIPLDPVTAEKTPRRVLAEGVGRMLQQGLGIFAILAMIVAVIITPTPLMIGLLVINVIVYLVFRRLAIPPKPKNWGIVYDEQTGKPIQNAVARIFETKYNKLLETQVTDTKGRYAFLVGDNVYYVTFEKPGYKKEQKGPVEKTEPKKEVKGATKEAQIVAVDVQLKPGQPGATAPKEPPKPPTPPVPPTPPAPPSPPSGTRPPMNPQPTPPAAPKPVPADPELAALQAIVERRKAVPTPPSPPKPPTAPPATSTPPAAPAPPKPVFSAPTSSPPPSAPRADKIVVMPTPVPPSPPSTPKPNIPWELQMLEKMKSQTPPKGDNPTSEPPKAAPPPSQPASPQSGPAPTGPSAPTIPPSSTVPKPPTEQK